MLANADARLQVAFFSTLSCVKLEVNGALWIHCCSDVLALGQSEQDGELGEKYHWKL